MFVKHTHLQNFAARQLSVPILSCISFLRESSSIFLTMQSANVNRGKHVTANISWISSSFQVVQFSCFMSANYFRLETWKKLYLFASSGGLPSVIYSIEMVIGKILKPNMFALKPIMTVCCSYKLLHTPSPLTISNFSFAR